jgi:hypothetical protein
VRAIRLGPSCVAGRHFERPNDAFGREDGLDGGFYLALDHLLHDKASEAPPLRLHHRRAIVLLPSQTKRIRRNAAFVEMPAYGDFASRDRQGTILGGVGRQFVQGKSDELDGLGGKQYLRTVKFELLAFRSDERCKLASISLLSNTPCQSCCISRSFEFERPNILSPNRTSKSLRSALCLTVSRAMAWMTAKRLRVR